MCQLQHFFLLTLLPLARSTLSCVDESGSAVDWWFMVKHPEGGADGSGTKYVFMTSATSSLAPGSKAVTDEASLLGKQLADVYAGSVKNYVFYNDQTPDGKYSTIYGHSKGFFYYDDQSAVWVQHSIPHFPNYVKSGYLYGKGQEKNGQHAFCMTMAKDRLNDIAAIMKYSNGWIYDFHTDGSLPNVEDVVNGRDTKTGDSIVDIELSWGTLRLMGKTVAFDDNMLQSVISPNLKQTMLSQSWLNTGTPFGPYCPSSGYDVLDIRTIKLSGDDTHGTKDDHSKWAVAEDAHSNWICALDNNHVHSQEQRSGLAVCLEHDSLSSAMRATVIAADSCDGPSPSPGPGPSPGPSPSPGSCCRYEMAADECKVGQTCCSGSGKSYQSESSCVRYGAKHRCSWTGTTCVVKGGEAILV